MKEKFEMEYSLNCSPKVLFNMLSTPGGLSEWFADDVNIKDNQVTFIWEGTEETAEIVLKKENKYIRFKWLEEENGTYFEFRLDQDELTNDVALIIVDHAEPEDKADTTELWDSQISSLKHVLGL